MFGKRIRSYTCKGCGHKWQMRAFCPCPKKCPECGKKTRPHW